MDGARRYWVGDCCWWSSRGISTVGSFGRRVLYPALDSGTVSSFIIRFLSPPLASDIGNLTLLPSLQSFIQLLDPTRTAHLGRNMASPLSSLSAHVPSLTSPLHHHLPIPLIDVYGAMRLSSIVNWMASGAFDPPGHTSGPRAKHEVKPRASLLQELFGLMVVVFGGETFLCGLSSFLLALALMLLSRYV